MEIKLETKQEANKTPAWKRALVLFGSAVLILIMIRSMKDAIDLQNNPDSRNKTGFTGEVVKISATALQNEYAVNEDSTAAKYKNKQLVVTGKIEEIDKYRTGESFIVLEKSSDAKLIKLQCVFKQENAIDSLMKGQDITVSGTPNFVKDVIQLEDSHIKK